MRSRYQLLVALFTLATLAVGIAAVWQNSQTPWRWYQEEFARRIDADLPARLDATPSEQDRRKLLAAVDRAIPSEPAIRQIYVPDLNQLSRCTSCHVALTEPLLARQEYPFRRHPLPYLEPAWHDVDQFGCLVCHGGDGRATDADAAHGDNTPGAVPRRKDEYAQASCGRCHQARPVEAAPAFNLGRWLVDDRGCSGCHDLAPDLLARRPGPPLRGLGSKTDAEWLTRWLRGPSSARPDALMPQFDLSSKEVRAIVDLLIARRDPDVDAFAAEFADVSPSRLAALSRQGRFLAQGAAGCSTCHNFPGIQRPGDYSIPGRRLIGLDLDGAGDRLTAAYVAALLADPEGTSRGIEMPAYQFADEDRAATVAFVMSMTSGRRGRPERRVAPAGAPPQSEQQAALDAMRRHGCAGCHDVPDLGPSPRIGPSLVIMGDRALWQIDWGESDVAVADRDLVTFLNEKVSRPSQFQPATALMPKFRLSAAERRCVVTYLLSRSTAPLAEKYVVPDPNPAPVPLDARLSTLNDRYRCLTCHRLGGQGGQVGPPLDGLGSKVRADWLLAWLGDPTPIRTSLQARMPRLSLAGNDIDNLSQLLMQLTSDNRVFANRAAASQPADIARAERLFTEGVGPDGTRAAACVACHRSGGRGGIAGPDLDGAAKRLSPAWIYTWLRLGNAVAPGTRMPTMALGDADARDLAGFLTQARRNASRETPPLSQSPPPPSADGGAP